MTISLSKAEVNHPIDGTDPLGDAWLILLILLSFLFSFYFDMQIRSANIGAELPTDYFM